jgi:hypothetical protein
MRHGNAMQSTNRFKLGLSGACPTGAHPVIFH